MYDGLLVTVTYHFYVEEGAFHENTMLKRLHVWCPQPPAAQTSSQTPSINQYRVKHQRLGAPLSFLSGDEGLYRCSMKAPKIVKPGSVDALFLRYNGMSRYPYARLSDRHPGKVSASSATHTRLTA